MELGTNRVVDSDPDDIRAAFQRAMSGDWPKGQDIPLWDGQAGARVARELATWLGA